MKQALKLIASREIFLRVLALAFIATPQPASGALLPLFITHLPGGTTRDVGILAGLVAGLEIPFMLLGGYFNRTKPTWIIILNAGIIQAAYLFGLDLMLDRPGLGTIFVGVGCVLLFTLDNKGALHARSLL